MSGQCLYYILVFVLLGGCTSRAEQLQEAVAETVATSTEVENLLNTSGVSVQERFLAPAGYERVTYAEGTFGDYLRHFPLQPHGAEVHYYNGKMKPNQGVHEAVLAIDVGNQDLQQCADAIMRLRAEYLYGQKQYDKISFNFTNGFRADYATWRQGNRIRVSNNRCTWVRSAAPATDYATFKDYLRIVFTYAGTRSLEQELTPVAAGEVQVGNVFIKGGSPGHAVLVVDVAVNKTTGEKLFMLAQSYMPAQEIHILRNPMHPHRSPWYSTRFGKQLFTPEWTFNREQLRRF